MMSDEETTADTDNVFLISAPTPSTVAPPPHTPAPDAVEEILKDIGCEEQIEIFRG